MDKYKEGMLRALTESENFETMWEIYDHFPTRSVLVFAIMQDFVDELKKSITAGVRDNTLIVTKKSDNDCAGVYLESPRWQGLIRIGFQYYRKDYSWYVGIWFDNERFIDKADDLKGKAATILPASEGFIRGNQWLSYKVLGNFDSYEDVSLLLPPNRDATIKEYGESLWGIVLKCRAEIDKWVAELNKNRGSSAPA
jgi:hypothetical protein